MMTGYPSIDKPWLSYYSKKAIEAKLPECTIFEYLLENNKEHLSDVALNYYGRKITFKELFDNIEKAAKAFSALGVKQGDIIVMATVTTPETIYAFYGLNRLGAITNMVDPRTSVEGIREYIVEVNAEYVLTIDVAYTKINEAIIGTAVKQIIVTSPADSLSQPQKTLFCIASKLKQSVPNRSKKAVLKWKNFITKGYKTSPNFSEYKKNQCCVIVHTGGTTGTPKGVMLSNDNINALVFQSIYTGIDMKREHTWMDIMPPFIAYGIGMGVHLPLVIGMETILIPTFNAKKFDDLLVKYKPVHMVFVPSYWGTIINSAKLKNEDLSYIIAPTVGGDTMDTTLEEQANDFLRKHGCSYKVTKGYGMTEVSSGVAGTVDENNKIGSVGIPFVKTIVSVFDPDTGKELSYNQQGEICITGPNTMIGYYGNENATNEIIRKHSDGLEWVHSGDIGYMDESGSIFILGRVKRMIIRYDGFKVFPSFIEKVIGSHNAVASCCAVGTPDSQHSQGKLPVVHIVLQPDYLGCEEDVKKELFELCFNELPEYAQPTRIIFRDTMPLTAIGKIDYRSLEEGN